MPVRRQRRRLQAPIRCAARRDRRTACASQPPQPVGARSCGRRPADRTPAGRPRHRLARNSYQWATSTRIARFSRSGTSVPASPKPARKSISMPFMHAQRLRPRLEMQPRRPRQRVEPGSRPGRSATPRPPIRRPSPTGFRAPDACASGTQPWLGQASSASRQLWSISAMPGRALDILARGADQPGQQLVLAGMGEPQMRLHLGKRHRLGGRRHRSNSVIRHLDGMKRDAAPAGGYRGRIGRTGDRLATANGDRKRPTMPHRAHVVRVRRNSLLRGG